MSRIQLIITVLCLVAAACGQEDNEEYPPCIQAEIQVFKAEYDRPECQGTRISQFRFQGETVYVFAQGSCLSDGVARVLSEGCAEICYLGSIAGIVECRGEIFSEAATREIVIWERE